MAYRASLTNHGYYVPPTEESESMFEEEVEENTESISVCAAIKLMTYLFIWIILVVLLYFLPAPHVTSNVTAILGKNQVVKTFQTLPKYDRINVHVQGNVDLDVTNHPNLDEQGKRKFITLYIEERNIRTNKTLSKTREWRVYINNDTAINTGVVKHQFDVTPTGERHGGIDDEDIKLDLIIVNNNVERYVFMIRTNTDAMHREIGVIVAAVLLVLLCVLMSWDMNDSPFACLLVALISVGVLGLVDELPELIHVINWVHIQTLMLLFSMMVIVSIMSETGFFGYVAVLTYRCSQGRPVLLLTLLFPMTFLFGAFIDTVTLMMVISPVMIHLSECMKLNTEKVLFCTIIFANICCCWYPTTYTVNIIIATSPHFLKAGANVLTFAAHMLPGVLLAGIATWIYFFFVLRRKLSVGHVHIRRSLLIVKRRSEKSSEVQEQMNERLKEMEEKNQRESESSRKRSFKSPEYYERLAKMMALYKIHDKPLLIKCILACCIAFILASLEHRPMFAGVSIGISSFIAASMLLLLYDGPDINEVLYRIDWATLLLYSAMFVLAEVCVTLGLIDYVADIAIWIIESVQPRYQIIIAVLVILWMATLFLFCMDALPLCTMLLQVVIYISQSDRVKIPLTPMIWALSYGICFGGNGSFITTTSNTMAASVAHQYGYKLSSWQFFKHGFPVMLISNVIASAYLIVAHGVLAWH